MLPLRRLRTPFVILAAVVATVPARATPTSAAPVTGSAPQVPHPLRLEYVRPPGPMCPDEKMLHDGVRTDAGMDPFAADAAHRLKVTVTKKGKLYQGHLEVSDGADNVTWTQDVKPSDVCDIVLVDVVGALGDQLRTPPPPPKPSTAPPVSSAAPSDAPVSTRAPGSVESPDDDSFGDSDLMRGRASMGTAFGVGVLPIPGLGPSAALGFQWRRFSMAVEGRVLLTPSFRLDQDHSAWAGLVLGILSICYQMASLPSPLYTLDFCPIIGAGRIIVQTLNEDNQPNYFASTAHPFTLMVGLRFPVTWQISQHKWPEFYLRTFLEGEIGLVRSRVSFNNVTLWDKVPPAGLTIGIEVSIVAKQPRKWAKPDPDPPTASEARSERRYW
jgi:hypothetical protein